MLYEPTTNFPSYIISRPPTHAIPIPELLFCTFFKWAAPQEHRNSFAVLSFINVLHNH